MPRYNPDGSRIKECENCLCKTCAFYYNYKYESDTCRFRRVLCDICKGRHANMFCNDYKRCEDIARLEKMSGDKRGK